MHHIQGPAEVWGACPEAVSPTLRESDAYRVNCNRAIVPDGQQLELTRRALVRAGVREPPPYYQGKRTRDGNERMSAPHLHVKEYGGWRRGTGPGRGSSVRANGPTRGKNLDRKCLARKCFARRVLYPSTL